MYNITSNPSKPGTRYCWHMNLLHPIWKITIASISNNTTMCMSRKRTKLFLQNILNPKVARMTDAAEADEYQKTIIAGSSSSKCFPLVFMQVLAFITSKVILIVVIYTNYKWIKVAWKWSIAILSRMYLILIQIQTPSFYKGTCTSNLCW